MMIGTASLVLVVTIGMTGKQYISGSDSRHRRQPGLCELLRAGHRITAVALDELTVDDVAAVRQQVPSVVAATPFVSLNDRISVGNGKEQDISILGVYPEYSQVRNLVVLAGRFFDTQDSQSRNKVWRDYGKTGDQLFGSPESAVGHTIKLSGFAVYRDRSVQGAGGDIWAIGSGRQHHGDPLLGEPVFSSVQCRTSDLFSVASPDELPPRRLKSSGFYRRVTGRSRSTTWRT